MKSRRYIEADKKFIDAETTRMMEKEKVRGTFAYTDNVTVCGVSEEDHDRNLKYFIDVAKKYNMTLNQDKCEYCLSSINLLGYSINDGEIRPDPDRLEPLIKLPVPKDTASLRKTMGMLAHYSRYVDTKFF